MTEKPKKLYGIYCPYCRNLGRDKLLFQADSKTSGTIIIKCRGCRNLIKIDLLRGFAV